jgi:hypothetical protein
MANTLTALAPKLLAQGLLALRNMNVLPALVNSDYSSEYSNKGLTVDVPIPSAIAVQNVAPGATPPATADVSPTTVQVTLDQWKEAPFYLTDKDMQQAMDGVIPLQASEAVSALADNVNAYILSLYTQIYGFAGVAATTPFATDTSEATEARKILNVQKAPSDPRRIVMDPDAEGNALNLRAFQDTNFATTANEVQEGKLARKLGFSWHMDQQVPTHTKGTLSGTTGAGKALVDDAAVAIGQTTIALDDTSLTGTIVEGDIFTVAGDTQTYVCTGTVTAAANAIASMGFSPAAKVAWADDAVLTLKASHVVNLAFHRDCIAFASRLLSDGQAGSLGSIMNSVVDPVSKIALRLEITREHKRIRFAYDILYGAQVVRAELGTRLAG